MDTSILKDLPRGVRAVLESSAPWADGYWTRRNPRVKLINYQGGDASTVTVDGCPVLTWTVADAWVAASWAAARQARAARAAQCRLAEVNYQIRIDEASCAAQDGTLRYVPGQEGGRLTLPSGKSVSARGLFRRVTGAEWVWDSMEFQEFLMRATNPPHREAFLPRKRRGCALSAHIAEAHTHQQVVQKVDCSW